MKKVFAKSLLVAAMFSVARLRIGSTKGYYCNGQR